MFVWDDGTITGSVNIEQLIREHPDHPEAKRLLALRGEETPTKAGESAAEAQKDEPKSEQKKPAPAKKTAAKKSAAKSKGKES